MYSNVLLLLLIGYNELFFYVGWFRLKNRESFIWNVIVLKLKFLFCV